MELANLARGPIFKAAFAIFVVGVVWRLVNILLQYHRRDRNEPRVALPGRLRGALYAVVTRSWPHPEFTPRTGTGEVIGYGYHIGLFVVVLFFAPHILFLGSFAGARWASLPSGVVTIVAVITFTLFLAVLYRRLTDGPMRRLSNFDDYFSWFIVMFVLATGLAATAHIGGPYPTVLGVHILAFDLLLIWFPFGKLMHAFYIFPTRAIDGYVLTRRGAAS